MTRRSRLYFNRKWFEKHSVKIPFKHEPSLINDLFMFGRAFTETHLDENDNPVTNYVTEEQAMQALFGCSGL